MKYELGYYWPDTETHFIEYMTKHGEYQRKSKELLADHVRDWSCVLDIGAHVGTWSVWFASKSPNVHCFEPVATNWECLVENTKHLTGVTLYNTAVSDRAGNISIWTSPVLDNTGQFSSVFEPGWTAHSYPAVTIDSLDLSPSVMKLDIQGGEYFALLGARETIKQSSPVICWENTNGYPHQNATIELLLDLGYYKAGQIKDDAVWIKR